MQILTTIKLTEIFVETDDFLKELQTILAAEGLPKPEWQSCFSRSEVVTTLVLELYLLLKSRCQPALAENHIDSKPLKACHIKREAHQKDAYARRPITTATADSLSQSLDGAWA